MHLGVICYIMYIYANAFTSRSIHLYPMESACAPATAIRSSNVATTRNEDVIGDEKFILSAETCLTR